MLNFVLCWFFFLSPYDKNIAVLSQLGFFALNTDKHLAILSKRTFDTQSIHIFGLVYYLSTSRNSPFYIGCYTYGKRFLFCSKLMFTNGNIVVCKYIIWFYSNLYFCQTHIWTSLLFIYLYQVLRPTILRYLCQYLLSTTIWLNGIGDLQTGWPALSMRKKIFFLASSLDAHCWLSKSSDPFPCSKQYSFHINMAGLH